MGASACWRLMQQQPGNRNRLGKSFIPIAGTILRINIEKKAMPAEGDRLAGKVPLAYRGNEGYPMRA